MIDADPSSQTARSLEAPGSPPPAPLKIAVVPLKLPPVLATLRAGTRDDLDALRALELRAFRYNQLARRCFIRFLSSPTAALIVAEYDHALVGYALVLFRSRSETTRLYSLAVDPASAGC